MDVKEVAKAEVKAAVPLKDVSDDAIALTKLKRIYIPEQTIRLQ